MIQQNGHVRMHNSKKTYCNKESFPVTDAVREEIYDSVPDNGGCNRMSVLLYDFLCDKTAVLGDAIKGTRYMRSPSAHFL